MKEAWFSKAMTSVRFIGALSVPSYLPKYGFRSPAAVSQVRKVWLQNLVLESG